MRALMLHGYLCKTVAVDPLSACVSSEMSPESSPSVTWCHGILSNVGARGSVKGRSDRSVPLHRHHFRYNPLFPSLTKISTIEKTDILVSIEVY